jgi:hypothetical protein
MHNEHPSPSPDTLLWDPALDEVKKQYGLMSPEELRQVRESLPADVDIVDGLIPHCSVNVLVGDSGAGKTALAYQLGLAVAAGVPFLDFPVKKGRVLIVDYENALWDSHAVVERQRRHVGLAAAPRGLLVWPYHPGHEPDAVQQAVLRLKPQLVIVDPLRYYSPQMERDSAGAAARFQELRVIARQYGAAFLLVHHISKRRGARAGRLEESAALDWLERAAGSRAIINHTDVRLGLAHHKAGDGTLLVLRGHARTRGEVGPYLVRRVFEAGGDPLGYERAAADPCLLNNPEQEAIYRGLNTEFRYRDAHLAYGKSHSSTNLFLFKLLQLGLATKVAHGELQCAPKLRQPVNGHFPSNGGIHVQGETKV